MRDKPEYTINPIVRISKRLTACAFSPKLNFLASKDTDIRSIPICGCDF